MAVSDLINLDLHKWRSDVIMTLFHREDADAITKIQLSRRVVPDSISWLHNKNGKFTVKSAYKIARRMRGNGNRVESSGGCVGKSVWPFLWKLGIPNKIKIFGWRACNDILPTRINLVKRRIINEDKCPICTREAETAIHVLWGCAAVTDVWAGSIIKLQKVGSGFCDVLQLVEYLVDRLSTEEMELFWVQSWFIWNQRNSVLYGGQLKNPSNLNKRAEDFLQDFKLAQVHLTVSPMEQPSGEVWQPPPSMVYKLNFDAAIFSGMEKSGFGAIIRNEKGEVMAGMSAIGPMVETSEEAELLACRRSLEFAVDAGFTRVVIEGDNTNVMQAISSVVANYSFLGNVVDDICHLMSGLQWVKTSKIRRGGNKVAHILAQHARNLEFDLYWLEDSPPPVVEALYQDSLLL